MSKTERNIRRGIFFKIHHLFFKARRKRNIVTVHPCNQFEVCIFKRQFQCVSKPPVLRQANDFENTVFFKITQIDNENNNENNGH